MKLATSHLANRCGLPRPIIKSQTEEKWAWPWAKIRTVNLVAEHVGVVTMCSTTEFTVLIFAVFDV